MRRYLPSVKRHLVLDADVDAFDNVDLAARDPVWADEPTRERLAE